MNLPPGFELVDAPSSRTAGGADLPDGFELVDEGGASFSPETGLRVQIPSRSQSPDTVEHPEGRADSLKSFGTGVKQGASLGFSDEIGALAAASGLPETRGPFSAIAHPVIGFVRSSLTEQGAKDYETALEQRRGEIRLAEENNPTAFLAGNLAGGLATAPLMPAAAPFKTASVLGRAGNAALTGGGYGATYGVGTGEDAQSRLEGGIGGGLIGGVTGGVASPIVDAALAGARAVASPVVNAVRGVRDPDAEALRRIGAAIEADRGPGAATRAADELEIFTKAGNPMTAADMGGETTRALARSAANTSPEGRAALNQATNDRYATQTERIDTLVRSLTGANRDTAGTIDDLRRMATQQNRPAYGRAYFDGQKGVWTPELEQLMQAPAMQDAVRQTMRTGGNRAAAQGFQPVKQAFQEVDGRLVLKANPDGSRAVPNLQFWDQVKRNLDDAVTEGQRAGRGNAAGDVRDLRDMLRDTLDESVPSYRDARRGAAAFFDAEDALEAGSKFINSSMENAEARRIVSRMRPAEKELFRRGFANSLLENLSKLSDTRNVTNSLFLNNARARERIEIALGPKEARLLEVQLRVENIMNQTRQAVQGNSRTTQFLQELGMAGGAGGVWGYATGDYSAHNLGTGAALGWALRRGRGKIDEKIAQRVGENLASSDPGKIRKAAELLASRPGLVDALRRGEEHFLKAVAPQVGTPMPIGQTLHAQGDQTQAGR